MNVDLEDTPVRRLAVAVARRGTSVRQLAQHLGADSAAFSRFAAYGVPHRGLTWEAIAAALGVAVEALTAVGTPYAPLVDEVAATSPGKRKR